MTTFPPVTAFVPCYNSEATIALAVERLQRQTVPVSEVVVIDDGSTDRSAAAAQAAGARVVRLPGNSGRGAANARGVLEAGSDLVVSCGATGMLDPDFVERAIGWFDDPAVAAVHGRVVDPHPTGVVGRWRARHLFRHDAYVAVARQASLVTGCWMLRRSAILAVGNFDARLRHSEDAELGRRLIAAGRDVVFDPRLHVSPAATNTLGQVLERYWRWGADVNESVSLAWYLKQMAYSAKVMVREDLAVGDFGAVPISLFAPHYQFWRSVSRRLRHGDRPAEQA